MRGWFFVPPLAASVILAAVVFPPLIESSPVAPGKGEEITTTTQLVENEGTGRILTSFIFPFFRQYQEIDLGENLNNLKSANTASYFIVRDVIAVSIIFSFFLSQTTLAAELCVFFFHFAQREIYANGKTYFSRSTSFKIGGKKEVVISIPFSKKKVAF